jgi:protein SCO1
VSRLVRAVLAVGVATACTAAGAGAHEPGPAPAAVRELSASPRLPVIRHAPLLALPDTAGRIVHLESLRGRPLLVSFIYTQCSSACPLLSQRMAVLQWRLRAERVAVPLLSVTVDPERDTNAALRDYGVRFGADPERWRFLRDEPARMQPVLAAWDEWTRRLATGEIDHPARIYLLDAAGMIREIYSLAFFDERQAWLDIQALLRER